ncbi:MAG: 4-hydroxy-3-methylbut-2-enyl diphosphate reductase [Candidatus Omnitrophica bacterium CG11_big_fil_rev_8_21_14_0_20_42_13]|uniref:4-hydroxy-3-methylbut-2-enyl diphosphate reductase n=1 Tax=Candidatus Ghiorseimicrobium undicola TaxID=1974746 RepID=A0A2H0LXL5_9BACT|nr:MAG: 4-hydroxy-3-methylbut-2-enyl diphosphate reductase [Candidatus Omnitrophica bacterium CG11_big_fil_rev_8_21_14_0_20_42_13]
MKINIAKSSGFCFGVRRAINTGLKLARGRHKTYILGDIVHNNYVVKDLEKQGIKKILAIKPINDAALIISAHGAARRIFLRAKSCGYKIVDATCPKVKDIYKIARSLEKNRQIIIIGDLNHEEVKGIAGQLRQCAITVESAHNLPVKKLKNIAKAAVVTQSTQTIENIERIMRRLERIIPDVKLYNTVCRTTMIKQEEIKTLPKENDIVLIIGSPTSANTKRLYEISRAINKKTYWIENSKGIKKSWFRDIKSVGIMAGASTPDIIVQEIVAKIKQMR